MSAESWAAAYRTWAETYTNPTDLARVVVREQIARVLDRASDEDALESSTEDQPHL